MKVSDWVNVLAIVLSPLIAVLVTLWVQSKGELTKRRYNIFLTLIGTRHSAITEEQARAYNSIDVIFHDCDLVRRLWRNYHELLYQRDRAGEWGKAKLELLKAMGDVVGYKNELSHLDLDRVYYPAGLSENQEKQAALAEKFSKALDSLGSISITARKTPE